MSTEMHYRLASNPLLELVEYEIARAPLVWERLVPAFLESVIGGTNNRFDRSTLTGLFAELQVGLVLADVAECFDAVVCRPVPLGTVAGRFWFGPGRLGGYCVHNRGTRRHYVEYDHLVVLDGLPTVIEVKMTVAKETSACLEAALTRKRLNQVFGPLSLVFRDTPFGYLVVVPKDTAELQAPLRTGFTALGGRLGALSATLAELRDGVLRAEPNLKFDAYAALACAAPPPGLAP